MRKGRKWRAFITTLRRKLGGLFSPARDGGRKSIYLGKTLPRLVDGIKTRVEAILSAQRLSVPLDENMATWVAKLNPKLAKKLAAVGLIPQKSTTALGPFLNQYLDGRAEMGESSKTVRKPIIKDLTGFFGESARRADHYGRRGRGLQAISFPSQAGRLDGPQAPGKWRDSFSRRCCCGS